VHALPLRVHDKILGALNLFHAKQGEIDDVDLAVAQAFADVASIAILQYRAALESQVLNEQLHHALNSRVVIEQAKGMGRGAQRPRYGAGVLAVTRLRTQPQSSSRRRRPATSSSEPFPAQPLPMGQLRNLPSSAAAVGIRDAFRCYPSDAAGEQWISWPI